jgi:quercetin dioxygenase-like cupin family protein
MKYFKQLIFFLGAVFLTAVNAADLKLDTLMKEKLEGSSGIEVIMSKVEIPPNTTLPRHWHPGEEFVYVHDGSVTLWQEGRADTVYKTGDAAKVPLKQVHTAITGNDGVSLIVFRVHEQGKPERVIVEDNHEKP